MALDDAEKTATSDDIRAIAGEMDNDILAALLGIGASRNEVRQAHSWLEESRYTLPVFVPPMSTRAQRVYEILDYADQTTPETIFLAIVEHGSKRP